MEERQRLTKHLGPDADTWWGVAEVCKQDLLQGRITPAQLKDLAKAISQRAEQEIERERREARLAWRAQMEEDTIQGKAKAFQAIRRQPETAQTEDLFTQIQESRDQWKKIWQGTDHRCDQPLEARLKEIT